MLNPRFHFLRTPLTACLIATALAGCVSPRPGPPAATGTSSGGAPLLQRGRNLMVKGQFAEAASVYQSVLKTDPTNAEAMEGAGLARMEMGEVKDAVPFLQRAIARDGKRIAAQTALAQLAYSQGLLAESRLRLQSVLTVDTKDADLWHTLGIVIREEQGDAAAVDAFASAVRYNPDNPSFRMDYADALLAANKPAEAEKEYRAVSRIDGASAEVKARFGAFLVQLPPDKARLAEAKPLLEQVVANDQQDMYARYYLGRVCLEEGDARRAIELMEPVVRGRATAEMREVWYALSRAYSRAGRAADAKRASETARRVSLEHDQLMNAKERAAKHPDDIDALLALARIFAAQGDFAHALAEYASVLHRSPNNPPATREVAALKNRLQAMGRMPDMSLFNSILSASQQSANTPPTH